MTYSQPSYIYRLPSLIVLLSCFPFTVQAADISVETLVSSCAELVVIYDESEKKSLYASISTSVAEAMRAGICRGMIEEHEKHKGRSYRGCSNGWREQALIVAQHDLESSPYDLEELLDEACNG